MTIEREHPWQHPQRLIHRVNDGAGDALVNDFRNRTPANSKDWSAARHRLDHYQAEWLGPIDREQKRLRLAEECGLATLIDLADELNPWTAQQRCDLFAEIDFIDLVYLGGDLQGNAKRPCNSNGAVRPLFGEIRPRNAI